MLFLLIITTIKQSFLLRHKLMNFGESLDSGHKANTFFDSCKREIKDKITKNEKQ